MLGLLGCDEDIVVSDQSARSIEVAGEILSKDPHWGEAADTEFDPTTATGWLEDSLADGEVLEQVRFTEFLESGHVLVEGVAQSAEDARLLVFDETGAASTREDLLQLEIEAHRARHGFLSHELHQAIATAASDENIDVIVYVDAGLADAVVPEDPPDDLSFEKWHAAYRGEKLARIAEHTAPVAEMLLARGAKDLHVLAELGIIRASMAADALLDTALNQSADVRGIELRGDERYALLGYAAHGAMGEAVFDSCGSYCEGSGQDVVVWEADPYNAVAKLDFFPNYNTRFGDRSVSQLRAADTCSAAAWKVAASSRPRPTARSSWCRASASCRPRTPSRYASRTAPSYSSAARARANPCRSRGTTTQVVGSSEGPVPAGGLYARDDGMWRRCRCLARWWSGAGRRPT